MTLRALPALVAGALLLMSGGAAEAGALSVSPLMLEMSTAKPTRTLEISNPSDKPVNVQLRVFAWTGGGTQENYAPTSDVGFSPPMFQLAPGAKQIVRLASRVTATKEMAYRLFVDQIEPAAQEGGISMPVRMALPLFVSPDGAGGTAVTWRVQHDGEGDLLVARNAGTRRLRVSDLSLETPAGAQTIERGLAGYVLAGQERAWRLKAINASSKITVKATTDQGDLRAEVGRN